jgi:ABC-2 type transport system ATP-binding protein
MLLGLLEPTSGNIEILGMNPMKNSTHIKQRIGYVGENQKMYDWMRIEEVIYFASSFHNNWDTEFCDSLLKRFKLDKRAKLANLSRGMYAQVALIIALAHHPELLILDDPTSGLDTVVRR